MHWHVLSRQQFHPGDPYCHIHKRHRGLQVSGTQHGRHSTGCRHGLHRGCPCTKVLRLWVNRLGKQAHKYTVVPCIRPNPRQAARWKSEVRFWIQLFILILIALYVFVYSHCSLPCLPWTVCGLPRQGLQHLWAGALPPGAHGDSCLQQLQHPARVWNHSHHTVQGRGGLRLGGGHECAEQICLHHSTHTWQGGRHRCGGKVEPCWGQSALGTIQCKVPWTLSISKVEHQLWYWPLCICSGDSNRQSSSFHTLCGAPGPGMGVVLEPGLWQWLQDRCDHQTGFARCQAPYHTHTACWGQIWLGKSRWVSPNHKLSSTLPRKNKSDFVCRCIFATVNRNKVFIVSQTWIETLGVILTFLWQIQDLFTPPSNDLGHKFQYGYVTHQGQQALYKLDLQAMKYVSDIDLKDYDCVPKSVAFIPLGGVGQTDAISQYSGSPLRLLPADEWSRLKGEGTVS